MTSGIRVSIADGVQTIRFARPEKKNAFVAASYTAMTEALASGDASADVAAHVFIGSEGVFTAGNDIGDFLATAQGAAGLGEPVLVFLRCLPRVKKPMIAAVDGLAVGIGTTLMFHCDLVYATPGARFIAPFVNLGCVPEAGSSLLAPRVMGHVRAFELLALGEPFEAEAAKDAGLVNRIVAADVLEKTAVGAGRTLAQKPPAAVALARRLLRGDGRDLEARIEEEATLFSQCMQSPEAKEAFTAFLEKRPPDFSKFRRA
jgi:enoyl-CoA hydratase/carnithine racemase